MSEAPIVRRRANGAIDFDAYRADATAMRAAAMRDSLTLRHFAGAVAALAVGAIAAAAAELRRPPRQGVDAARAIATTIGMAAK